MVGDWTTRHILLRLLPSGPDRIGRSIVRQSPGAYMVFFYSKIKSVIYLRIKNITCGKFN